MKTRMNETQVKSISVRPQNGLRGVSRLRARRTILSPVERFGPHLAGLGVVMLIAVVFLEVWWAPNPPRNSSPGPGNGFTGWGSPPGRNFQWYVSHGQLKADARTALAMLEDVLSPERDLWGRARCGATRSFPERHDEFRDECAPRLTLSGKSLRPKRSSRGEFRSCRAPSPS